MLIQENNKNLKGALLTGCLIQMVILDTLQ